MQPWAEAGTKLPETLALSSLSIFLLHMAQQRYWIAEETLRRFTVNSLFERTSLLGLAKGFWNTSASSNVETLVEVVKYMP